jgi:gliding motility-associated-like protein
MKKYLLILFLLPFISFGQQTNDIRISGTDSLIYSYSDASCYASCDGQLQVSVFGPNTPYSFIIGASNDTLANGTILDTLCPNNYSILVLDGGNNLVDVYNVEINAPSELLIYSSLINNPTCHNESTGLINLATFGDNPFLWSWNNGEITEDIAGLDSGMYVLTTTDGNGCSRIDTFTLINPSAVTSSTITDTLSCIGLCDGIGIVTPSDGVAPYTYQWSNGDTDSITVTGLCYGLATVFITDDNGCLDTNAVFIENPDTLKLSNITIDSACYQICDGQLSITIEGGESPYATEWSIAGNIFNTTDTITNNDLCPGDYQLIYTDANSCSDTVLIPLIERDSFLVQDWVIDDSCYNSCTGQITVQLLNPVNLPIIYSWDNGGMDTIISNLCSDTFELVIIDNRLCSDTFNFFIAPGDSMYFDTVAVTHNSCYGDEDGVISLINFNGGVQPLDYLWSNTETTSGINSLPSGFYNVTITDANGCSLDSSNIEVSQPDSLFATASSEDVSCFGGSDGLIDIDLFGGVEPYFISWDIVIPDSTLIDTVSAGVYIYSVIDSNNCTITDTIIIEEPEELIIADSLIDLLCKGESTGEIHLTVTGGISPYEYSIDDGVTFQSQAYFDNLSAGSYSIIVKDANDCEITSNLLDVSEPLTNITAGLTSPNLLCFGDVGTIILSVSGGTPSYSFLWSNGAITQNLIGAGSGYYEVTIFDANDCELVENINVSSPDEIIVSEAITHLSCFEDGFGAIDISITGGITPYVLSWSNGQTTSNINGLDADTYTLNLTDDNGCTDSYNFDVEQPDLLELTSIVSHVACFGESNGEIDISVTGGTSPYNFDWSNLTSNEDLLNILSGNYSVIVTDDNNCKDSASVIISEPSDIVYSVSTIDLVCNNIDEGQISVLVSGGTPAYSYSIDGGATYQSSNNFYNLQSNNYDVVIQDASLCQKQETVTLNQPIGYSTSVIITDVEGCNGESTGVIDFTLSGNTPPYAYNWSNNESSSSIYNLTAGNYDVIVSDANNCEMTYSYLVTEPNALNLQYDILLASCEEKNDGGITTVVTGGTLPYSYLWGNEETNSDLFNIEKGTYSLYLEDSKGCSLPIEVIEVGFDGFNGCIEIPSGFTPNNDNIHDEWVIYGLNDFPDVIVKIYNRWGQELFSSSGYPMPWDGKYNGVDLPTATYYYVIELNESDKVFNGTVTIKR